MTLSSVLWQRKQAYLKTIRQKQYSLGPADVIGLELELLRMLLLRGTGKFRFSRIPLLCPLDCSVFRCIQPRIATIWSAEILFRFKICAPNLA